MAAYASLVTLARNIDPIHGDLNHIYLDMDLKPLYEKVVELLAIMENCPGETLSQEFQAKIRDYADRAKRVIDTHYLQVLSWKRGEGFVSLPKFHEVTDEASSLILEAQNHQSMQIKELSLVPSSSSSAYAPRGATRKVRLYSDITNLEEKLYEGCSGRQVIPIVGMGGSGKTTLANFLFNDSRTPNRFDLRAWITVSQSYERCTLLSEILRQLNESAPPEDAQYKDLGVKVFRILKNRRYLIVIDDVWSEKLWVDINIYLPDDDNGSRILLTTRLQDVANYVVLSSSESHIHMIEFMGPDSSWSLLKDTVFGEDGHCPDELQEIGKSIAKKCKGLPIAIVVIAGFLSSTKRDLWEKIEADVTAAINLIDGVEKIFSLSYVNLPHHLKPCILYLARFPEDYKFEVSGLIMLWIAEGFLNLNKSKRYVFIRPKNINNEIINSETYEEESVAYEYLEDLVKRNLILVSRTDYNGKIMECRLHDVIRKLCIEIAGKENFMFQVKGDYELTSIEIKDQTRFNFCSKKSLSLVEKIYDDAPIPTMLYSWHPTSYKIVFRTSFCLLRVLDAEDIEFTKFPSEVMQLFLLRYLAFGVRGDYGRKVRFPSSIKELQNLQVLKISTSSLLILPLEIWDLPKLRHLISTDGLMVLADPPIGTRSSSPSSSLENLQSLLGVDDLKFTEQVVQMIPNVKMLGIRLSERHCEYCLWNLVGFAKLEALKIRWGDFSRKNILLPPSLKELILSDCHITWSDLGEVAGSLPNLEVMKLSYNHCYDGDVWEVKEGEFPNLKVLEINDQNLASWKYDGRIFPNLERLELSYCLSMKEFPRCIGDIDTLRLIRVALCNKLLEEWAREVEEEQESYGNEYLQVIIGKEE